MPATERAPLAEPSAARLVVEELAALSEWQVAVPHFTVMPNHWHALIAPDSSAPKTLSEILKRVKGRTAKHLRQISRDRGPLWQREWF